MLLAAVLLAPAPLTAQAPAEPTALERSVEQLGNTVGRWAVTTEFLKEDGTVARSVTGTYEFSWVVPDRVVSGVSRIPELSQISGILFFINEKKEQIEMVSVGADGRLWEVIGPLGEEVRRRPSSRRPMVARANSASRDTTCPLTPSNPGWSTVRTAARPGSPETINSSVGNLLRPSELGLQGWTGRGGASAPPRRAIGLSFTR